MVSPELLRRFPLFAGLDADQITALAKVSDELEVEAGHCFFHEGDELDTLYLVLEGEVGSVIELIEKGRPAIIASFTERERGVVVSTIGPGEVFAWSALVPPHNATTMVKALSASRVLAIDCVDLRDRFDDDPRFGFILMQRAAQGLRDRLRDMRMETLALMSE